MNRQERRKHESEQRRATKRRSAASAPPAPAPRTLDSATLARLDASVQRELSAPASEEALRRAAALAADEMDAALQLMWARSGLTPACARGCSYCGAQAVAVTIPELLRMVAYARETLTPEQLAALRERAAHNASLTHGATILHYPARLDCAFLGPDRTCSVHAARPLMCRREHAMDVAECRCGYEQAGPGEDYPIGRVVRVKLASDEIFDAYHDGLAAAGVDATDYELQEAAHIALSVPEAGLQSLAGNTPFASARLDQTDDPARIPTPRAPRRLPVR